MSTVGWLTVLSNSLIKAVMRLNPALGNGVPSEPGVLAVAHSATLSGFTYLCVHAVAVIFKAKA